MISRILLLAGLLTVVHGTFFFCPPNEIWSSLKCSDKCSDLGKGCVPRTAKTFINFGCVCLPNFKRDPITNGCIPKASCCKLNGPNEIYSESGFDRTCASVVGKTIIIPPIREGKCICDQFSARNIFGKCVPIEECYPKCPGENEVYKKQGCEEKCNLNGYILGICTPTSGCFCKPGFFRQGKNRKCVAQDDCECDGANECYKQSGCDKNCKGLNTSSCPGGPGCYCLPKHMRKDGKCIKAEMCKKPCSSCGGAEDGDTNVDSVKNLFLN